ncbi:MAG: hypothetical protein RR471_07865 [Bacteroides sp.]
MLLSCTQETLDGEMTEPVGGNVELRFKAFDTNATTDPEKAVNRVRVVVFGSYSSTDRGKLICNRYAIPDATGTISPILISAGMRDIYLVVNEPLGTDGTELASYKNIQSYDDLSNLQIPYKGGVGADVIARDGLPMLGCYINRMVRGESNVFGADVEYLMAKVSLNVTYTDGGITENPNLGDVKVTGMKVCNIPYYSTVIASTYNSKEYYSPVLTFTGTTNGTTTNNTAEFYLPEHIVKNADSKTYVEVKGKNLKTDEISTWIVKLGDATVTTPTPAPVGTPYNITRNMHYTVTGTIKSYGEVDVALDVKIAAWNPVWSSSRPGEYIACDKTDITLTQDLDAQSTIETVKFSANNLAGAVIRTKNGRVAVDQTNIATGDLKISLAPGIEVTKIDDYINFDEVTIIVEDYAVTIKIHYQPTIVMTDWTPKGMQVPWDGGTGTVFCETTVGEWYLVLKDDQGNVYATSAKTAAVTDNTKTTQQVSIQLPVNVNGSPINYVVEVHHERLLPETKFSAKHMFRNTQQAGHKLTLIADGTSSFTPTEFGGEGALLSSTAADGKRHDMFFKYGSLLGIKSGVVDGVRTMTGDAYDPTDVVWKPINSANPTAWTGVPVSSGLFTHDANTVKAMKGDPCRMVGLTTHDMVSGKVDNGKWKMATTADWNGFLSFGTTSASYTLVFTGGASIEALGFRNNTGTITQQKWTLGGPFAHGLTHVYSGTLSHVCVWYNMMNPDPTPIIGPSGGINSAGYANVVGAPNAQNAMSIRCVKIRP